MPDTLLNGYHHEPFRKQQYLQSEWPVDLKANEIWDISTDTFKNKAIVLFGQKVKSDNLNTIPGRRVRKGIPDEPCEYRLLRQGRRTAWSSNPDARAITEGVLESIPFLQGADIMPRTLVFHRVAQQPNGKWSIQPIPRQGDGLSYLVAEAKNHVDFSLKAVNIDDQFIYDCYISKHILPFYVCSPAKALLPIKKKTGRWNVVDEQELITYGTSSSAVFTSIFKEAGETARQYFNRINYRNKLNPQIFEKYSDEKYLVMAGAGGGYTCAAYVPLGRLSKKKTIIDQTLYWYIAQSEDEALFITGLLNSQALDDIIADFQPEGAQGRRHVHKLPYAVTPPFNADNSAHLLVVETTRALKNRFDEVLPSSKIFEFRSPARSSLSVRRRRFRLFIQQLPESRDYEDACRGVYNV